MELILLIAVVAVPIFLIARVAGNRRREDPMAHAYGLPPWLLLGGLFFWSHGTDAQSQPGVDATTGLNADAGTWGITGGSDFGGGGFGGGGFGGDGGGGGGAF